MTPPGNTFERRALTYWGGLAQWPHRLVRLSQKRALVVARLNRSELYLASYEEKSASKPVDCRIEKLSDRALAELISALIAVPAAATSEPER